jgi:hypothetical protein
MNIVTVQRRRPQEFGTDSNVFFEALKMACEISCEPKCGILRLNAGQGLSTQAELCWEKPMCG